MSSVFMHATSCNVLLFLKSLMPSFSCSLCLLQGLKAITESLFADISNSASDAKLQDGADGLEKQPRNLPRFELKHRV